MNDKKEFIKEDDTVYDTLKKYPEIKEVLIKMNKVFTRLNNPVLFKSVARVTTLKKAAEIGKIYVNELLYKLNEVIGKEEEFYRYIKDNSFKNREKFVNNFFSENITEKPDWLNKCESFKRFDYSEKEEEPFLEITKYAFSLQKGEGFILIQNFKPSPLINYLKGYGFDYYIENIENNKYIIYFFRKEIKDGENK